jgi:hypothetical protein
MSFVKMPPDSPCLPVDIPFIQKVVLGCPNPYVMQKAIAPPAPVPVIVEREEEEKKIRTM